MPAVARVREAMQQGMRPTFHRPGSSADGQGSGGGAPARGAFHRCGATDRQVRDFPQGPTCFHCGEKGHQRWECHKLKCHKCNGFGHKAHQCGQQKGSKGSSKGGQ